MVVGCLLVVGTLLTEAGVGAEPRGAAGPVTVLFLLFIYALVIVSALKLRGQDEDRGHVPRQHGPADRRALGNAAILGWSVYDDPASLLWCAGLVAVGVVLFLIERYLTPDR